MALATFCRPTPWLQENLTEHRAARSCSFFPKPTRPNTVPTNQVHGLCGLTNRPQSEYLTPLWLCRPQDHWPKEVTQQILSNLLLCISSMSPND